ncbi:hypothetical protein COV24_03025 [candidate division WWE3 bacterium CG10_big_fil_rev_8_21_14_0_10_32_10]|uniref:Fido domain-containing protein n=1 Tax=candidate division WWE3 bacterium CG10_big_fil_rev_8_21_14_0_10_32_10 TaxID=1975090 RepID=A0A2H0RA33_UNCKA|nr:MAG: hypothetical protein COV24_03025 [candidate division WWE3 bacterium CG10_big_fil_rev_8_21_14_0_10_32_10]
MYTMLMLTENEVKKLRDALPGYKRDIFPPILEDLYDNKLVSLLGEANRAIGNLNNAKKIIPNPDLLSGPLLFKEAFASSEIEGTQTTVRDVIQEEVELSFESRYDQIQAREVVNHIEASKTGLRLIKEYPLVSRVLKEMHSQLLEGVRGKHKTLGDFRVGPNAIEKGNEIVYFPPEAKDVSDLMSRLERYLNNPGDKDIYDPLIRAAVTHYEFEAIHPFADGNGRLGRVLISLQLINEKVLTYPVLYLSGFLLREKKNYQECLLRVTTHSDWKGWITFFLRGIKEQATRSEEIVQSIYDLRKNTEQTAKSMTQSPNVNEIVDLMFSRRVLTARLVRESLNMSHSGARKLLVKLTKAGLLSLINSGNSKANYYVNEPLVKLLENI